MFWLLLSLIPNALALFCFSCGDYMGVRSVCSSQKSCTGTRCLIVHLNNATSFSADCYSASTNVSDFCWRDPAGRTLCACKTRFCNSPAAVENLTLSDVPLLPEVNLDDLLQLTVASASTTALPGPTTSIGDTAPTLPPFSDAPTSSPGEATTVGLTGETTVPSDVSPTPAQAVPSDSNSTATPVATTTNSAPFLYSIQIVALPFLISLL